MAASKPIRPSGMAGRWACRLVLLLALTALPALAEAACTPPPIRTTGKVASVAAFQDSMGVGARPVVFGTRSVLQQLAYLGVRHVRVQNRFRNQADALAAFGPLRDAGIGMLVIHDPIASLDFVKAVGRACIDAVEAPNEINQFTSRFRSGALTGMEAAQAMAAQTWSEAQAWDPRLPVLAASQAFTHAAQGGDMTRWANALSLHIYGIQQPLAAVLAAQKAIETIGYVQTDLPFWITETGTSTYTGRYNVPERLGAIRAVQAYLDGFVSGAVRTYIYELQDEGVTATDPEQNFGLFRNDGTPKLAATAIRALNLRLRASSGPPGADDHAALDLHWTGLPSDARVLLLRASDRSQRIVLWRENRMQSEFPPVPVALALDKPAVLSVFDVVDGTVIAEPGGMASSVSFELGSAPLVVSAR